LVDEPSASTTVAGVVPVRHDGRVIQWEYARLEYNATGSFGTDKNLDWAATLYHQGGVLRWGTDEKYDDIKHLNRAGALGWQAYDRAAMLIGQPQRLYAVTFSLRRPAN
jgi:hypothetical protein